LGPKEDSIDGIDGLAMEIRQTRRAFGPDRKNPAFTVHHKAITACSE